MNNEEKEICYNMQVYNNFVDFPIAMTNIENFEFDKLLTHPNPKVREFSLIVITKCISVNKSTVVKPIIIIYNKKDWNVRKYKESSYTKTIFTNRKQTLDFRKLIELPCNNQNEIINKFNIVSKILIVKNKFETNSLVRKKY